MTAQNILRYESAASLFFTEHHSEFQLIVQLSNP